MSLRKYVFLTDDEVNVDVTPSGVPALAKPALLRQASLEKKLDSKAEEANRVVAAEGKTSAKSLLRSLLNSGMLTQGKKARRRGGRKQLTASRAHPFTSIFGSNNFTYDTTGVFTFLNRVYIQDGIVSGVTGLVQQSLALNPSVATQWTAQSSLFDSYRIAEIRFSLIPDLSQQVKDGTLSFALDADATPGTTALSSVDEVLQYDTAWWGSSRAPPGSYCGGAKVPPYTYKCPEPGNADVVSASTGGVIYPNLGDWCDIGAASTGTLGLIFVYGTGISNSINVASYVLEYVVQFRALR